MLHVASILCGAIEFTLLKVPNFMFPDKVHLN